LFYGIFITKEYIMELNRFKQLLESTMGNVKPLIMEQETGNTITFEVITNDWSKLPSEFSGYLVHPNLITMRTDSIPNGDQLLNYYNKWGFF
jgi:hypothetical protein